MAYCNYTFPLSGYFFLMGGRYTITVCAQTDIVKYDNNGVKQVLMCFFTRTRLTHSLHGKECAFKVST